jgi:hypothetical protein
MRKAGATCLALDAGKRLLLDGAAIITAADEAAQRLWQTRSHVSLTYATSGPKISTQ